MSDLSEIVYWAKFCSPSTLYSMLAAFGFFACLVRSPRVLSSTLLFATPKALVPVPLFVLWRFPNPTILRLVQFKHFQLKSTLPFSPARRYETLKVHLSAIMR